MTCKDCIHFDVCFYYGEKAIRDNTPNAEIGCDNFKNKADYAEVKHGEWVEVAENSTGKIMACTNCKKHINPNKKDVAMNRAGERPNYCPNCGAKMDGRSEQ